MPVLVSDSSVLIDLERCQLLREVFALASELVVPDLLFERELREYGGQAFVDLGLRVESLTPAELAGEQQFVRTERALSAPDAFSLALARARQWTLLTGDGLLRDLAEKENVECHGVLWLLDLVEGEQTASLQQLHDGLRRLVSHPRCRLPKAEVNVRLDRYSGQRR